MKDDVFTYMIGGRAGQGVKKAGTAASKLFTKMGRRVFQMDDYQSLIRGGHNFSVVSTSKEDISSHRMKADVIVNLDDRSYENHKKDLAENGVLFYNSDEMEEAEGIGLPINQKAKDYSRPDLIKGVAGLAVLSSALDVPIDVLNDVVKEEYAKGVDENLSFAQEIYQQCEERLEKKFELKEGDEELPMLSGNESIALGASAGGLDIYIGYPMTPASSILHFMAEHREELQVMAVHPESEIGVANMAVGATMPGARTMVGSSGGGIALMEEAFSLAGMVESPLLFVLSSRPGPSTGVPTYTEQGDLNFALNQGHGEFPRVVASPGTVKEAFQLTSELLSLLWRFQTPGILLTEKHLSESRTSVDLDIEQAEWAEGKRAEPSEEKTYRRYADTEDGVSPLEYPPSEDVIKWNSYEHDESGITTEEPELVKKMHDKRRRKRESIIRELQEKNTVNTYGRGENLIFTYGSSTMSVLEATKHIREKVKIIQPRYLRPFPVWTLEEYMGKEIMVIEQSSTGQFASLLREKLNVTLKDVIRRYDGRAFEPLKLAEKIEEAI